jgi:hypothetical protein
MVNYSKIKSSETKMEFVKRLTSPLCRNALVKWTLDLLCSSFAVLKPIFYVRHQKLFITAATVKMNRKLRVSEKAYKANKMKTRMDNARSHSRLLVSAILNKHKVPPSSLP